jgi:hypothetical protein
MIRRIAIGAVLVVLLAAGAIWRIRSRRPQYEEGYVGQRHVTLSSSTAVVREQVTSLGYGDRVEILARSGDELQVRTAQGLIGWMDARELADAAVWRRAKTLDLETQKMPVQARGHTKAVSNLRIEPGRETARIFQLGKDVPVEMLARRVVDVTPSKKDPTSDEQPPTKQEDWWLVRAKVKDIGDLAGWVIGRFVELDLPAPLPDYATAAGMRVVGWFELNHVVDTTQGNKPQYLVIGARGGQMQPCDFTLLRVYTWGSKRQRYETAYVESDACGRLPVRVTPATQPGGDASFQFTCLGKSANEDCIYRMHQTIVRRVRQGGEVPKRRTRR